MILGIIRDKDNGKTYFVTLDEQTGKISVGLPESIEGYVFKYEGFGSLNVDSNNDAISFADMTYKHGLKE